ncbi:hypothetical protein ABPG77_010059 [Micractinium sp. CCAP 211/92]
MSAPTMATTPALPSRWRRMTSPSTSAPSSSCWVSACWEPWPQSWCACRRAAPPSLPLSASAAFLALAPCSPPRSSTWLSCNGVPHLELPVLLLDRGLQRLALPLHYPGYAGMHAIDFLIKGYARRRGVTAGAAIAANGHGELHEGCAVHVVGAIVAAGAGAHPPPLVTGSPEQAEEGESVDEEDGKCPVHGPGCKTLLNHKDHASAVIGVYMADAGIMFHSVIIGLTLGVTSGTSFITLLIAIILHQLFEGLAIGSAAVDAGLGALRCAALGVAYSVTTPVGIAIGIGIRASFNANSTTTLLATA